MEETDETGPAGTGRFKLLSRIESPNADALPHEAELLGTRREALGAAGAPPAGAQVDAAWHALALSGGGIRSATFSLGVLQALAEQPSAAPPPASAPASSPKPPGETFRSSLLSGFDYLSTVSGGGYIGAFLNALFVPGRLDPAQPKQTPQQAADQAVEVLCSGPPGRLRLGTDYGQPAQRARAPLAWLRESGRYLSPTGVGDTVYAAAMSLRNWLALHFVIGTALLLLLALAGLLRWHLAAGSDLVRGWEVTNLEQALRHVAAAAKAAAAGKAAADWPVWWSLFFPLSLAPLVLAGLPSGIAFWLTDENRDGCSAPLNRAVFGALVVAGCLLWVALRHTNAAASGVQRFMAAGQGSQVALGMAVAIFVAVVFYVATALCFKMAVAQRVFMTRWLSVCLQASLALAALALVDTLGQTFYLLYRTAESGATVLMVPSGLAAVLVWLVRKGVSSGSKASVPGWLSKLPLTTLGGLAGLLIFVLVASLWSFLISWVALADWELLAATALPTAERLPGEAYRDMLPWILLSVMAVAVVVGCFPGFINLSSYQPFYSSRLTRAYLGASNGNRFSSNPESRNKAFSTAEPMSGDNLELSAFLTPGPVSAQTRLRTLAPLHIINVTLNQTVDPAEQLVQRDRKGRSMAVLPFGFAIDGKKHGFPRHEGLVTTQVKRLPWLGEWTGISGAAFSTGIGRETSLGMSLLTGAANVRLGVWWETGVSKRWHVKSPPDALAKAIGAVLRTQTYLSYELRARFFGTRRRWQYLSDGGHFENTGLYELLRPERRVAFVVACDNGADHAYQFDDLANLIRLVRIDFGRDVQVEPIGATSPLAGVFGSIEDFAPATAKAAAAERRHCALLLKATPARGSSGPTTWIVLIKPNLVDDAPADVQQYGAAHPTFPQETTADQFFDEAQWESYRRLGYHQARRVLAPAMRTALRQHTGVAF